MGFAQFVYVLEILVLLPGVGGILQLFILALGFLMTWLGVATAHEVRGWRAALLPIIAFLVVIVASTVVGLLLAGAGYTLDAVLGDVGVTP